ncbi:MAG: hypothetical protein ACE5JH_11610 [Acidobacteriota bacterium]
MTGHRARRRRRLTAAVLIGILLAGAAPGRSPAAETLPETPRPPAPEGPPDRAEDEDPPLGRAERVPERGDEGAPDGGPAEALEAPWVDPRATAGGALRLFMASRSYRTIRALKAAMTQSLSARYDRDSAPFNGRQRIRIAAFDFREADLKPVQVGPSGGEVRAYDAKVRSLWAEQGEAVELRVESIRVLRQEDGLWRVGRLRRVSSEPLRFTESSEGLTTLRLVMRAWRRRQPGGAREQMSGSFLRRFEGREQALEAIFVGADLPRHSAYQILAIDDERPDRLAARLRLYETSPGHPWPLDGVEVTLTLVKIGHRWYLDGWNRGPGRPHPA